MHLIPCYYFYANWIVLQANAAFINRKERLRFLVNQERKDTARKDTEMRKEILTVLSEEIHYCKNDVRELYYKPYDFDGWTPENHKLLRWMKQGFDPIIHTK